MRKVSVILIVLLLFTGCSAPPEPLTEDEIAVLREEYPIRSIYEAKRLSGFDFDVLPLDEVIEMSDHWVWAQVGQQLPDEGTYQRYEMQVVESVYGELKKGETFVFAGSESYMDMMTPLDAGREYLMGLMPVEGLAEAYCTTLAGVFYVLEDEHVLSVAGLEPLTRQQLAYTGQLATDVIEVIRETKIRQGKEHRTITVDWATVSLEEACEKSDYIVYGQIKSISKTKEFVEVVSDREFVTLYRDVKVDVVEWFKGWKLSGTVTFPEMGGETDDMIMEVYAGREISIGDEMILFVSKERGTVASFIADEEGVIGLIRGMVPGSEDEYTSMPIQEYCEIIRSYIKDAEK